MNAKFEKWTQDNGYMLDKANGMAADSFISVDTFNAWTGYKAAIQSLEVTRDLVEHVRITMNEYDWLAGLTAEENIFNEVSCGLVAFLSALKEQAK